MSENVFLVWNGWGIVCLFAIAIWQLVHAYVSAVARHLSFLRNPLVLFLALPAMIGGFLLAGWVVGLINIPIGFILGILLMKLFLPSRL